MVEKKPAYSVNFNPELHKRLSGEIRAELGRHRISISEMAEEVGISRPTATLWLLRNTTQERFDKMNRAILKIISKDAL